MQKFLTINYSEHASENELTHADRELVEAARHATETSYSPYSHFRVGAAARVALHTKDAPAGNDNAIVTGSNQENLAYPSGLCAERVALFGASAQHGDDAVVSALAIAAIGVDGQPAEASPCGACRQVMVEQEQRQGSPMRILVALPDGSVREYQSAASILPFSFLF